MRAEKIGSQNFGMRITDNLSLQMLQYHWRKKFNSQDIIKAFQKIKNAAPDTFELTFNEFLVGKPSEILIRNSVQTGDFFTVLYSKPEKTSLRKVMDKKPLAAYSPAALANVIVERVGTLVNKLEQQHTPNHNMTILKDISFARLIEYWKKRATMTEINQALNKITSSADSSYSLAFKNFIYENPRKVALYKNDELLHMLWLHPSKRFEVVNGRKITIGEPLAPMQTAESLFEKISEVIQKGFVKRGKQASLKHKKSVRNK